MNAFTTGDISFVHIAFTNYNDNFIIKLKCCVFFLFTKCSTSHVTAALNPTVTVINDWQASGTGAAKVPSIGETMDRNKNQTLRKPKLAPIRVVNGPHLQYIQEQEREREHEEFLKSGGLGQGRPVSTQFYNTCRQDLWYWLHSKPCTCIFTIYHIKKACKHNAPGCSYVQV